MKKALFAMAFHSHQPVDNFGWELERAYDSAYEPLLAKLEGSPGVKASFHYSGNVLEWLEREHPDHIERVAALAGKGQVEIIGGGCFEPVLAMIPERDALEQIKLNEGIISRVFGKRPRGVWIAEKVWEPRMADTLAGAGVDYTIVDDHHMLRAGLTEEEIYGPCSTGSGKSRVTLFPSLTKLRYNMPFKAPEVTRDFMRDIARKREGKTTCFFFADDTEKFGAWPYTYSWVHKKGWLKDFFGMLEDSSDWLRTATYSEVLEEVSPSEAVEVPASSYAEMMEWSGGDFRNFFKKYPESDRMRTRMLGVSGSLRSLEDNGSGSGSEKLIEAKKELFKAQTNCAYWHGTFGGVYLPHLRSGVYGHLICAENIVEDLERRDAGPRAAFAERDLGDGKAEKLLVNDFLRIFVDPASGGALTELDYRPLCLNLVNTISRVREGYHDKLEKNSRSRINEARKAVMRGDLADVHNVLGVKDKGLEKELVYDDHRRDSFLTHIFRDELPWRDIYRGCPSHERFRKEPYAFSTREYDGGIELALSRRDKIFGRAARSFDLEVVKDLRVDAGRSAFGFSQAIFKHAGEDKLPPYAVELNFSVWDDTVMGKPRMAWTDRFKLCDRHTGVEIAFRFNRYFTVCTYPLYTVNETEAGLSRTFQGVSVMIGDDSPSASALETPRMDLDITIGKA